MELAGFLNDREVVADAIDYADRGDDRSDCAEELARGRDVSWIFFRCQLSVIWRCFTQ